ncbi:LOW QUALITY PROTEIN: protein FAM135A [Daphnia magna]|uniref:LOW QUALITY PROTEIN: protein FAM135A n=1 Tax=Daphnia magna TaxID=35525 RepID=UPI001E1BB9B6|nr:LOW QUALITY PROTEIN: protein FAM135A [Daphnia magna]
MGDLQATLELFVELNKFYNVDLFQRGIYQVRGHLRTSPKIAVKLEGSLYHRPNGNNNSGQGTGSGSQQQTSSSASTANILHPACVLNGSFISQTFQILYRNEDVCLSDMAQFRLHVLVDSHKIEETLERLDLHLVMELWFSEQGYSLGDSGLDSQERFSNGSGSGGGGILCVSSRTLQLHLSPTRGLHYHLPVLFDYFHLAAITVTVHASLIAVHQPYIKRSMKHLVQSCAPRSGRSRMGNNARTSYSRYDESSFDSFFFPGGTGVKSTGHAGWRLAQARQVHRDVCSLLSASAESLRSARRRFLNELPEDDEHSRLRNAEEQKITASASQVTLGGSRDGHVSDCEEEFVAAANNEIGQLCAHNVLLWRKLLDVFAGSEPVRLMLAQQHHAHRVRRFAEAFYVVNHPRPAMANCNDADVHTYLYVTEALRKSRYLASLPPLPVECLEMNGDINTLPVIFEDRYEPLISVGSKKRSNTNPSTKSITPQHCDGPLEFHQPIYEEINPQTPTGNKALLQQQSRQSHRPAGATLVVNHVYRSLPQTPLISGASPSVLHHHLGQQELLLGDHRRRSYGGEKGQIQAELARPVVSMMASSRPDDESEEPLVRHDDDDADRLNDNGNSAGRSRFKFRPLVTSKSSENFQQLRRVAMAAAARRNPSLPVKLLGYKPLMESSVVNPQSNSESLPDLKFTTPHSPSRQAVTQRTRPPTSDLAFCHSVSDPALVRASSGRTLKTNDITVKAMAPSSPLIERLRADGLNSSASDCSDQSGWVSSTMSSRQNSPPPAHHRCRTEHCYPDSEPAPLAPPEEFQDPPRLRNFAAKRYNLNSMLISPKRDAPPEGTRGTFRSLGEDVGSCSSSTNGNQPSRSKPRPLSQEELRLLQLLLYEMCRPGQPNPLIRALSHSLYESLAVSLSLTSNNPSGQNYKMPEPNVSHSTSLPCLIKNHDDERLDLHPLHAQYQENQRQLQQQQLLQQQQQQQQQQHATPPEQRASIQANIQQRSVSLSTLQPKEEKPEGEGEGEELLQQKLVSMLGDGTLSFLKAKEDFKRQIHFNGTLYSDIHPINPTSPYFHVAEELRPFSPEGLHLIVCVHGLDGNSADLRLVKTYLELVLPGSNLDFLMSERNQGGTFSTFDTMTDRLVSEIFCYLEGNNLNPKRISFVGHSLGTIIIRSALTRPQMRPLLPKLHTFLSLSGPHLGTLYNSSGLVNMGLWLMQRWKKSGSLQQLSLKDAEDPRNSFLYKLARNSELHHFRYVILSASAQDRYVPLHSARVEMCRAAVKDPTVLGTIYQEMVHNILGPLMNNDKVTVVRYDIHHALPSTANALIGRAAHIAVLDSELFIEKFLLVVGSKYFQ